MTSSNRITRRFVLSAGAASPLLLLPRAGFSSSTTAASDRLVLACVGIGGKGESDIDSFAMSGRAEIGFLCDVDDRMAAATIGKFPRAKFYRDWRRLFAEQVRNFDAVSISTPDHTHAVIALAAMQLGKHVYVQKPLARTIEETRLLAQAAQRYRVVAQMGNQGASADGVRQLREWYDAGLIGRTTKVYSWTNKPIAPQGLPWPSRSAPVPQGLDWDLWLGPARYRDYVGDVVPFNWRGYWDFGSGAIGDMGAHLVESAFRVLDLAPPIEVQASAAKLYSEKGQRIYAPESAPVASHVTWTFAQTKQTDGPIDYHWMDGGITIPRPEELAPDERFGNGNGTLFVGTKGKMVIDSHGANPMLLPYSRLKDVNVPQTLARVPGGNEGHYAQWINACLAGYGKAPLSSPFDRSADLTETLQLGALALRAAELRHPRSADLPKIPGGDGFDYPGRTRLFWDSKAMKVTNLDEANQFVRSDSRAGWKARS